MVNKLVESLIWLSRWYNGRAARLSRLHADHSLQLEKLIRNKLGFKVYRYEQEVVINGIKVIATCTPDTLTIHHVGDASRLIGARDSQLLLFREGAQHRGKAPSLRKLQLQIRNGGKSHDPIAG